MRPQGEERSLLVKLNDNELAGMGEELADAVREEDAEQLLFAAWQANMKDSQKAKKEHLAELHRETSRLAAVVDAGAEERQVSCSWLYALSMGMAFLVRDDTGELVDHRELAEEERQLDLGAEVFREPTPEEVGRFLGQIMAQRHVDALELTPTSQEVLEISEAFMDELCAEGEDDA